MPFKCKGPSVGDGGVDLDGDAMVARGIAGDGEGGYPCCKHGWCGEFQVGPQQQILAIVIIHKATELMTAIGGVYGLDKHVQHASHVLWALQNTEDAVIRYTQLLWLDQRGVEGGREVACVVGIG